MSNYSISVFKQKDPVADKIVNIDSWLSLKAWLKSQKQIKTDDKKYNNHIVSGITKDGYRRKGCFHETSKVYFTDIDNMNGLSFNDFIKRFNPLKHNYIAYNSASCRRGDIRIRMVFHLSRPVKEYEFLHFWTNLNRLYENLFDPQTNYIEKTNACPRTFKDSLNFIYEHLGNPVDVDEVKDFFIYRPPENHLSEMIKGLFNHKKKTLRLNTSSFKWSGVNDCPFIPKKLVTEYNSIMDIDGSGRFSIFYKIMIAIACNANQRKYDITEDELLELMMEIDANDHQKNKQKNNLTKSVRNAIIYANKIV